MKIGKDKVVTIEYTLTDSEGTLLDQSEEGNPFTYLHGSNLIVPGLEKELEGKKSGDDFSTEVFAKDAYGEWDEKMVHAIPRDQFEVDGDVVVGMQFEAEFDNSGLIFTVVDVQDDKVIVDGNHVLAGVDLVFAVKVIDVREATQDELKRINHSCGGGCGQDHSSGKSGCCGGGNNDVEGEGGGCCGGGNHYH